MLCHGYEIAGGIWGGRISAAKINAEHAGQRAKQAAGEANRLEAYAWFAWKATEFAGQGW
jgi:hypothetical protein